MSIWLFLGLLAAISVGIRLQPLGGIVQRAIAAGVLALGFLILLLLGVGFLTELVGVLLAAVVANLMTADYIPQRYRIVLAIAVAIVFFLAAPWLLENFRLFQFSRVAIWVIVAVGLNILTGYNGQISLGHGAFVLIGAYTSAILMDGESQLGFVDGADWPFWTTIIAAAVVSGVAGFALGFPALRLSGPYLAIATLALVISMPAILRKYDGLTGGAQGIFVKQPPPPPGLEGALERDEWLYLLCVGVAIVMTVIAWGILRGRLGRAFVAVRDSEVAAAAMGINVARVKIAAFTISALYAGVAGALLTQLLGVMTPESVDIVVSINFLTAIVIGGLASLLGAVVGAFALVLLPSDGPDILGQIPLFPDNVVQKAPGAIQGAVVVFVVLLMPFGVAGSYHRLIATPAGRILDGVKGIPTGLRARVAQIREDVVWAWEDSPLNRRRARPDSREEADP
ncbi:MAG TPA: branched-chain amino acid ABC transporter permease [Dehalococcoidia bacterium]